MSASERMKHVLGTLDYSNRRLNDENIDYSKLINESRNKVASILNKRRLLLSAVDAFKVPLNQETKIKSEIILENESDQSLHDYFKSMMNLTNYLLYGILSPLKSTSISIISVVPIFSLEANEQASVEYFAKEIDSIQEELLDISDSVKKIEKK